MKFLDYVRRNEGSRPTLVVVNRSAPDPLQMMLEDAFEGQPVDIEEYELDDYGEDVVLLVEEGETVAVSDLSAVQNTVLMVNSDLYITGAKPIEELELPDVLTRLSDVAFSLRGYPESNKEKLLLIAISRHIERVAHDADGGTLRSSFQNLSRINDEKGTRTVYEKVSRGETDVHVYGVPDWMPQPGFDVTVHSGYSRPFQDVWFVVHTSDSDERDAALVAVEVEPRVWEGFWTFDDDEVDEINAYIERTM